MRGKATGRSEELTVTKRQWGEKPKDPRKGS